MQTLSALPEVHLPNAKIQFRNELGTSVEIALAVYLETGITELLEDKECLPEVNCPNITQGLRGGDKAGATLVSSWKRSFELNK